MASFHQPKLKFTVRPTLNGVEAPKNQGLCRCGQGVDTYLNKSFYYNVLCLENKHHPCLFPRLLAGFLYLAKINSL